MLKNTVIGLMLAGFAVLICGSLASIPWRKQGVTARELWMAGSKVVANPQRYIRPDRVLATRVLSYVGVGLWLAGVLAMVAGTVMPLLR